MSLRLRVMFAVAFCMLLAVVLTSCGGGTENAGGEGDSVPADAETIYKQRCIQCHGNDLKGKIPNTNLQQVGARLSAEQIAETIQNGNRRGMPSFRGTLKEAEITTLAEWLAEKK